MPSDAGATPDMKQLTWFKSSYSGKSGGQCVEA
ncbi:DUF397 domain-containing protein [Kitasatospora acidiphila]